MHTVHFETTKKPRTTTIFHVNSSHIIHSWEKNSALVHICLSITYCGHVKWRLCSVTCACIWLQAQGWDGMHSFLSIHSHSLFRNWMWATILSYTNMNKILPTNDHLIEQWNRDWEWLSHFHMWESKLSPEKDLSSMFCCFLYHLSSRNVMIMLLSPCLQIILCPTYLTKYGTSWNFKSYFCPMAIPTICIANISTKK